MIAADLVAEYHSKDNGLTPDTAGAYVAQNIPDSNFKIEVTGKQVKVIKDEIVTEGEIQDDGHIAWNDEGGQGSSTSETRDIDIETAITTRLNSETYSERLIDVSYNPSGTYLWDKELATSDQTGTETLNSASGQSFNVNTWRVLDVNTTTGVVRLVPKTYASGKVRLQGAMGYNNAVKLLNDACSSLYSDSSVGATARSINMDDIEAIIGEPSTPIQLYEIYSSSNSKYPVIYGNENLAVINGGDAISDGVFKSQQTSFIQRSEGTSTTSNIGVITTATSIRPYHTYYVKDYSLFTTELENKSGVILTNRNFTSYWVSSRYVSAGSSNCIFGVFLVNGGSLGGYQMLFSTGLGAEKSNALFPIVSLGSGHLVSNGTGGYTVQ
ncbi:MAG: hypothetical protein IKG42_04550 [Clostridia bacterium]|nr:hypothetical protein [Clostridia bacterium]